ncbi:helix-turn-helix domain-containing protein [Roseibacterium beibuensis]|uniref:AraC family transcriptional regulator n=1 Tax=[Roseibacterium] beibuensis TaxID=1193142 RepID=UPI00217D53EE|nr:helix-turn-helix domain-containing protein [Roseibacterium beibuensis]MCS6624613.1 helix-turn-helix domain-containing protein [Roseibacterium beibuensis]
MRHALFQILTADDRIERHRHGRGYAAVVLAGGYVEAGDRGRFRARPGQVLIHGPWESHMDAVSRTGAVVLNLPLSVDVDFAAGTVPDPDAVARAAQRDLVEAAALLFETLRPLVPAMDDWPDQLAEALRRDPDTALAAWARAAALAPATVSRGFRQVFGASPRRYRAEQRALKAARLLLARHDPPAALAAELGFVDQAHMTRAVTALTGLTPGRLRVKSIQSGVRAVG